MLVWGQILVLSTIPTLKHINDLESKLCEQVAHTHKYLVNYYETIPDSPLVNTKSFKLLVVNTNPNGATGSEIDQAILTKIPDSLLQVKDNWKLASKKSKSSPNYALIDDKVYHSVLGIYIQRKDNVIYE